MPLRVDISEFKVFRSSLAVLALTVLSVSMLLSSCITPSEKEQMKEDIFSTQTRLLNLERLLDDTSKDAKNSGDSATRRIASTQAELERLSRELAQVHGDIDSLRVGVLTGQMPGVDPAQQEHSLATAVTKIGERVAAVEAAQEELIEALKKAPATKSGPKKKDSKPVGDLADLQKAFDDKHYKQVVEDAQHFFKGGTKDDREKARFLLAESYFRLGDLREAALRYNDFIEGKPAKKYLPSAKMHIAECFRHLGDAATAKIYYQEVVRDFPNSEEAAKAKERLSGN